MSSPSMPNIDLNPHDWEEVRRILKTYVPEYDVWAFGSRAEWSAKAYSDLDLAVITDQPLPISTSSALKEAFAESTLSIKVDVVDWATTSESFRGIIKSNKIIIQFGEAALAKWTYKKLIDCTRDGSLSYGIVQPGQHAENGIPIIRVNNFNNGQLRLYDVLRVSPEIEAKYKRTRLKGGEVLLTLVGSTGLSAVVPDELAGWNIARAVAVIRPRPEIGANWINICLQTKDAHQFLDERANTTVQKTLNLADVRDLPIPLPPSEVKEQIEAIAMSLSDKIEFNRQINQTLEQIAQAIFKSWFLDFEPVRAKMQAKEEGRDPEGAAMRAISSKSEEELDHLSPEQHKQLSATAAQFPDELVESELGEIPKGWETRKIETLLKRLSSKVRYTKDEVKPYGSIPVFEQGSGLVLGYHDAKAGFVVTSEDPAFIFGDHTCVIHLACQPFDISQNVIPLKGNDRSTLWVYYAVKDKQVFQEYRRHWMELIAKDVVVAPEAVCKAFAKIISSLHLYMEANVRQNCELEALRDTLLPKLLSGEMELKEVS